MLRVGERVAKLHTRTRLYTCFVTDQRAAGEAEGSVRHLEDEGGDVESHDVTTDHSRGMGKDKFRAIGFFP